MRWRTPAFLVGIVLCVHGCGGSEQAADAALPVYAQAPYAANAADGERTTIQFSDIAARAGIDFVHETGAFGEKWMPETMGSGGGFLDYDEDGWPDIFLVNGSTWPGRGGAAPPATSRLYRNLGNGAFEDVSVAAGLTISVYGMGAAFADYDADGDTDIYITAVGDNRLLRNDDGVYTDVTQATGTHGNSGRRGEPPSWSTAAAWVDTDRDGFLDLFVCGYVKWTPETDLFHTFDGTTKSYATPEQYQGDTCLLYRNRDGVRFHDVTREAGVFNPEGKSLGVAVADFNDDQWPDIVVANDMQPNFLYVNEGDGTFEDVALRAGVAYDEFGRARAGMGIDVADVGGEGKLSIAIGNFSREPISLYTQIGSELFQDLAGRTGVARTSLLPLTFGLLFADFDLDGYEDLIVGNGHIEPTINAVQQDITFAQSPQLFWNRSGQRLVDVSEQLGSSFTEPVVARGIAVADIDRDGDLDVLMTTNGGRPKLLRNDLLPGANVNWIQIRLAGEAPNRHAIGALVTVYADTHQQRKMVKTGSSYLSQSDVRAITFGLGNHRRVDSLSVRWPTTGKVDTIRDVQTGRQYVMDERTGRLQPYGRER